jgi:multiple antibiotic resistance protein
MYQLFVEAFVTLFIVIDPIGLIPIFVGLTNNYTIQKKKSVALKSCIIGFSVMLVFSFVGNFILNNLKISEEAFKIAGGILLFIIAIDMVISQQFGTNTSKVNDKSVEEVDISVYPIAIPLIAGPGTLTSILIIKQNFQENLILNIGFLIIMIIMIVITYVCLVLSKHISDKLGNTGTNIVTRIFGLILSSLSIQLILDGIHKSFNI